MYNTTTLPQEINTSKNLSVGRTADNTCTLNEASKLGGQQLAKPVLWLKPVSWADNNWQNLYSDWSQ
jgi:hypothetical protein